MEEIEVVHEVRMPQKNILLCVLERQNNGEIDIVHKKGSTMDRMPLESFLKEVDQFIIQTT